MTHLKELYSTLLLAGTFVMLFSSPLWAAEGIISKVSDSSGTFCNLKFPAIKEETLTSDRPALKDPSENDIVDFYGPCDHDPDLLHRHEAHESAEFFPAAEGRAVNFQVLGNNRRNIIIGLTACGSATGY